MKNFLPLVLFLSICFSCNQKNLLTLKSKKYFSEKNYISNKDTLTLNQGVCYFEPGIIDGGYCYNLSIVFKDSIEALRKKVLNLETDTAIVVCSYGKHSVWNWDSYPNKISGEIEILNWETDEIELRENIKIKDVRRNERKIFQGDRIFRRK